jgi:predicted acylesterase/phospholipase RssA
MFTMRFGRRCDIKQMEGCSVLARASPKRREMKPFRKNVAIAIDGGGMRGVIIAQALAALEDHLKKPVHDIFRLCVGTSTGSILSAGIAAGFTASAMTKLYIRMGKTIFPDSVRKVLFPLTRYRYPVEPFTQALDTFFGSKKMGDFWKEDPQTDLVVTTFDLQENRTRFVKSWKEEFENWPVSKAVRASCSVPTYFPILENRYIDGGIGSYSNPCYIAAYEAKECLKWNLTETTLISIGTGRNPNRFDPKTVSQSRAWDWIGQIIGAFSQSADDQQVNLVETSFRTLDFRRFQINLRESIEMDDTDQIDRLVAYGSRLGGMIINDRYDTAQGITVKQPESPAG